MTISHATAATGPDGTVPGYIQPSHWNAAHTVDLTNEYSSAVHIDMRGGGTTGDGVANDTGAFSAQMAALVALGGGSCFIPPGKIYLTDLWTLSTAGMTIRFYGGGTIKLRTGTTALIRCTAGRIILDGVKLDGNGISIANNNLGLVYINGSTAYGEVYRCEITNVGLAGSATGCGITTTAGGQLRAHFNNIHDCLGYGVRIQTAGKFDVSHNNIHDCGSSAVFAGQASDYTTEGGVITGNTITDIRADAGGTGANGNGISLWNLNGVVIGPNTITRTAFSFVRVNSCADGSITGVVGNDAGETGIFLEFGANNYSVTGCVLKGMNSWGISVANLPSGVKSVVVSNCHVFNFGRTATRSAGIQIEYGLATNNIIDGNGNTGATWGISTAPPTGNNWLCRMEGNDIAGTKYDIGLAASSSGGTQRAIVARNSHVRSDANYSSPFGSITGGTADGGNGSVMNSSQAGKVFSDRNYFNVPTTESPLPGEIGSTMKIQGVWKTSNGSAWV